MKPARASAVFVLLTGVLSAARARGDLPIAAGLARPDTLIVRSGALQLRGLVYRPLGPGPFPAILFNHGSGHASGGPPAQRDQRHPEVVGPLFARHGYVLLYLYRRGDGLSAGQGTPSADLMNRELAAHGQSARNRVQLRLLEGDEMADVQAGLRALRGIAGVDPHRVGIVGHSFGGSLTLLLAARDSSLRAAISFSGSVGSWDRSPTLRSRLRAAVDRSRAPIFFIHAANDFSVAPGESLAAEMARHGRPHRLKIYPPIGVSTDDGHAFVYLGPSIWESDVFEFLDAALRK